MKKRPENKIFVSKAVADLFAAAVIPDIPVLLNKRKLHDSIAAAAGSIVMAGQHMRESVAELNSLFTARKKQKPVGMVNFKIKKAVRKNGRSWKHRKVKA